MKKYGYAMELTAIGVVLLLAMASDAGSIGLLPLFLSLLCCAGLLALGDLFTRPCRSRRLRRLILGKQVRKAPAPVRPVSGASAIVTFPPAA